MSVRSELLNCHFKLSQLSSHYSILDILKCVNTYISI